MRFFVPYILIRNITALYLQPFQIYFRLVQVKPADSEVESLLK